MGLDLAYGRLCSMARVNDSVIGEQLQDIVDGIHQLVIVAARQVRAADVVIIYGIARESYLSFLAVKEDRAWRMPRCVDHLELVVAEGNLLAVSEVMLGHGNLIRVFLVDLGDADEQVILHDPLVILMNLGQEAITVANQIVAIQVIVMGMGEQQTHRSQALSLDETDKALAFTMLVYAAVDDDGFARLVPNDVGTLLKSVDHEFLYLYHLSNYWQ